MTLGIVTAVLFVLTAAKFVTRRLPFKKLDAFMLKIHKLAASALLVSAVAHGVTAWKLIRQRPAGMYVVGIALIVFILAAFISRALAKSAGRGWVKVHRAASALICAGLLLHAAIGGISFFAYQKAIADITPAEIYIGKVADGTYDGEYDAGYIYAKVAVTMEGGKIMSVDILEHRNERGKTAEKIVGSVISAQSLNVDAVSGATNSSKVIKKAIENALMQGISK